MWEWKEKWIGKHICLYLSGKTSLNKKNTLFWISF